MNWLVCHADDHTWMYLDPMLLAERRPQYRIQSRHMGSKSLHNAFVGWIGCRAMLFGWAFLSVELLSRCWQTTKQLATLQWTCKVDPLDTDQTLQLLWPRSIMMRSLSNDWQCKDNFPGYLCGHPV
jgi:hypothetical protein